MICRHGYCFPLCRSDAGAVSHLLHILRQYCPMFLHFECGGILPFCYSVLSSGVAYSYCTSSSLIDFWLVVVYAIFMVNETAHHISWESQGIRFLISRDNVFLNSGLRARNWSMSILHTPAIWFKFSERLIWTVSVLSGIFISIGLM